MFDPGMGVWEYSYDAGDRLTSLTYPDGEVVNYTYDDTTNGGGKLDTMASTYTYLGDVAYAHVSGQPTALTLGTPGTRPPTRHASRRSARAGCRTSASPTTMRAT